mmetsp:Transcript_42278/g.128254  ORF Transcript_42278/g.128254 Transcript_42278/m.128254 type:complete len:230 (-) Transcript_42278:669-1358(-)
MAAANVSAPPSLMVFPLRYSVRRVGLPATAHSARARHPPSPTPLNPRSRRERERWCVAVAVMSAAALSPPPVAAKALGASAARLTAAASMAAPSSPRSLKPSLIDSRDGLRNRASARGRASAGRRPLWERSILIRAPRDIPSDKARRTESRPTRWDGTGRHLGLMGSLGGPSSSSFSSGSSMMPCILLRRRVACSRVTVRRRGFVSPSSSSFFLYCSLMSACRGNLSPS